MSKSEDMRKLAKTLRETADKTAAVKREKCADIVAAAKALQIIKRYTNVH